MPKHALPAAATHWNTYTSLARSLRKTHSKQTFLKTAGKSALSLALPLAALPLVLHDAHAQVCQTVNLNFTQAGPGSFGAVDIDMDGNDDLTSICY